MKHARSCCPVACVLDILGDKWTLLVVRDLFAGCAHYKEFAGGPERIATNILANRLEKLVTHGLVETYPSPLRSGQHAYRLTKKGKSLGPVLKTVAKWGLEHIPGTEARIKA